MLHEQSGASIDAATPAHCPSVLEDAQILAHGPKMLLVAGKHAAVLHGVERITGWTLIPKGIRRLRDVRERLAGSRP